VPRTCDDGYAARLNWDPLGWKIAGTTPAMREKLRVPAPICGRTFRRFACARRAAVRVAFDG
jgi:2-keto-4-pentenoate hydratase